MSKMMDEILNGAGLMLKGAAQIGKVALDGAQKVLNSDKVKEVRSQVSQKLDENETISNLKNTVTQKVSEVAGSRGIVRYAACDACGAKIPDDAKFCPYCAAPVVIPQAEAELVVEDVEEACCTKEAPAEEAPCCCAEEAPAEEAPCCCAEEAPAEEAPCCCAEEAPAEEEKPCCCAEEAPAEEEKPCCCE